MDYLFPILSFVIGSGVVLVVFRNGFNPPLWSAHQYINQDLRPTKKEMKVLNKIALPNINQTQAFLNEYCNVPKYNGSYIQLTNNYKHQPNQDNCETDNRNFELCPWPYKVYEGDYLSELPELREKPKDGPFETIPHQPLEPLFF